MNDENKPKTIRELLFSPDLINRIENFERDIEVLNKKYEKELPEGDSIAKHVFIQYPNPSDDRIHFNVNGENEIPTNAAEDMRAVFRRNFDPHIKPV